jgi:hypothetical protein
MRIDATKGNGMSIMCHKSSGGRSEASEKYTVGKKEVSGRGF